MNAHEVLYRLDITRQTLTKYVKNGIIKAEKKENGQYEYDDESVYKLLNERKNSDTKVISWSPATSWFRDDYSPGTLISGQSRIPFINKIATNCIEAGENPIIFDLRGNLKDLYNNPDVKVIKIKDLKRGAFNPFTFYDTPAFYDILDIVKILYGEEIEVSNEANLIQAINDYMKIDNSKDIIGFAKYLLNLENEFLLDVGKVLSTMENWKPATLITSSMTFTKSSNKTLDYGNILLNKPIIISFEDMSFSPIICEQTDCYLMSERISLAILYMLFEKLLNKLRYREDKLSTIMIDDVNILFQIKQLAYTFDKMIVYGKTCKKSLVVSTEDVTQLPKNIFDGMASKFIFRSNHKEIAYLGQILNFYYEDTNNHIDLYTLPDNVCVFYYPHNYNKLLKVY